MGIENIVNIVNPFTVQLKGNFLRSIKQKIDVRNVHGSR